MRLRHKAHYNSDIDYIERGEQYKPCLICGRLFSDADGCNEIVFPITIPALNDLKVLVLPAATKTINEEALSGLACEAIIIPYGCTTIEKKAFAECEHLLYVYIPSTVTNIATDAFSGCNNVYIDSETE